jgi:hypothetical protein
MAIHREGQQRSCDDDGYQALPEACAASTLPFSNTWIVNCCQECILSGITSLSSKRTKLRTKVQGGMAAVLREDLGANESDLPGNR